MGKSFGVGPEQGSLETLENKGYWKKPEYGGDTFQWSQSTSIYF